MAGSVGVFGDCGGWLFLEVDVDELEVVAARLRSRLSRRSCWMWM